MTIEHWLASVCADVERRNLPDLKRLLTSLSQAMQVVRDADWNDEADGGSPRGLPPTKLRPEKTPGSMQQTPGSAWVDTPGAAAVEALPEAGPSDPASGERR